MPVFQYIAVDEGGKKVQGTIRAETESEVLDSLANKGLTPVSITLQNVSDRPRHRKKSMHSGISPDDYLFFARQMAVMLDSGVPLLRVLTVLASETNSRKLAECIEGMKESVSSGWSLEKAMSKYPGIFNSIWRNIVKTGETTGKLGFVIGRLADHIEREVAFVKKIRGALVYPAFVLVVVLGVMIFLSVFLIPMFEQLLTGMGQDLPTITKVVFAFSRFLRQKWYFLILGVVLLIGGVKYILSTSWGKALWDRLLLSLPVVGDFVRTAIMESIAANLYILVESGVPILTALDVVGGSTGNTVVAQEIKKVRERVREGVPLAYAMEESGFFDSIMVQMISVGEEVGELADMVRRIAVYYENEMEDKLSKFVSLFEPALIVVMAGIVGTLVASVFIPLFQLVNGPKAF